jgi:predicted metal-dependent phosphoesterase TrpH
VTTAPAIDLHTHSWCSDGSLRPAELVARAAGAGLEVLALTDHDTIAGVEEAAAAATQCGLRLVPGVEVSASWRAQGIHVLGLWIDPACSALRLDLEAQAAHRALRMRRICGRLTEIGLPGERLLQRVLAHPGLPTRAHLAAALVAEEIVAHSDDAFRKYLGRGRAAHIAAEWPPLASVVAWIVGAGGTACLAHPARYRLSGGARRQLLADFAAAGGTALEVITGGNAPHLVAACCAWAEKFGLTGSLGSDFHHPEVPWNPLGRLSKLPPGVTPVWRSHGL